MLRNIVGITALLAALTFFFIFLYYFLFTIAIAEERSKFAKYLGPFILVLPSMYDEKGRRVIGRAVLYLVLFLLSALCFVLVGEAWPRA